MCTQLKSFRIVPGLVFIAIILTTTSALGAPATVLSRSLSDRHVEEPSGPTDPAELEAFLDRIIEPQMKDVRVAGATIAVVRDAKLLLAKGYGYADVARSVPVHPDTTLFRIGSTTKLFTWTAIMQLVEQGKLDLGVDINTYLDFKIPATYPGPITLKHLMSHTAGFEDISLGLFPPRMPPEPLGAWLSAHIPARVRPPGLISAYSNYGVELAGYIVERISGIPYEEYIERNLFEPLGMEHTAVRQPLPHDLAPDMSLGYKYVDGSFQAQTYQWLRSLPAGAISSTASDMARFMIAHLQDGRYGDTHILQEQTARQMHGTLFKMDERVNGFAYGFFERDMNGQRVIGHPGSTLVFSSDLILLPQQNLGLFVSYNTFGAETLIDTLILGFMNHYYPVVQQASALAANPGSRANDFLGSYRLGRSSHTNFEKVNGLLLYLDVSAEPDGALLLGSPVSTTKTRIVPIGPLLFREETYGTPVVFRQSKGGEITHLLITNRPDQTWEKLAWFEAPSFHYALVLVCALLFLSVLVAAVAGLHLSKTRRIRTVQNSGLPQVARWLLGLIAALNLVALANFLWVFVGDYSAFVDTVTRGDISPLHVPLLLWLIAALLTVVAVVFTVDAWKNRYWNARARVHYTLVTLAALAFIWFLNYWNLLGWRL